MYINRPRHQINVNVLPSLLCDRCNTTSYSIVQRLRAVHVLSTCVGRTVREARTALVGARRHTRHRKEGRVGASGETRPGSDPSIPSARVSADQDRVRVVRGRRRSGGGGPGRRPPASLIVQGRSPTHGRCGRRATDRRGGSAVVQVCIYAPCMWCGVDRTTYVCRTGADDRQPRAILTDVLHPRRDNVGHVCTVSPEASEAGLKDRSTPRARCPHKAHALARNTYLNSVSPGRLTPTRRPTSLSASASVIQCILVGPCD